MCAEYITAGLTQMDLVIRPDGSQFTGMGGTPMYGWAGMRLWTSADNIHYLARVGRDFDAVYGEWFKNNGISLDHIKYVSDTSARCVMYLDENLDMITDFDPADHPLDNGRHFRPFLSDLEEVISQQTKGLYICGPQPDAPYQRSDRTWDGFFEFKKQNSFKVMWEPNSPHTFPGDKPSIDALFEKIELLSFNLKESMRIFGMDREEDILGYLRSKRSPELILLRCGARGMYTINRGRAWFIPALAVPAGCSVVDTTGCGNAATAAAMVAWCEGDDPVMAGIKATISANYTLRQGGPYPLFTNEISREALVWAQDIYDHYELKEIP